MSLWHRLTSLFRTLLRQGALERDLDDELQGCLQELVARQVRAALTPDHARREALIELGGTEQLKEEVRRARIGQEIVTSLRDVRLAGRLLRRSPGSLSCRQ